MSPRRRASALERGEKWLGRQLGHLLAIATMVAAPMLLIYLLWSYVIHRLITGEAGAIAIAVVLAVAVAVALVYGAYWVRSHGVSQTIEVTRTALHLQSREKTMPSSDQPSRSNRSRRSDSTSPDSIQVHIYGDSNAPISINSPQRNVRQSVYTVKAGPHTVELKTGVEQMSGAIARSRSLTEQQKEEARELLRALTECASMTPGARRPSQVEATMRRLGQVLSMSASIAKLWQSLEPVFREVLHVHGI